MVQVQGESVGGFILVPTYHSEVEHKNNLIAQVWERFNKFLNRFYFYNKIRGRIFSHAGIEVFSCFHIYFVPS